MSTDKVCRVNGCERTAKGRSVRCDAHQTAHRRHGDAEQKGVTTHELKPWAAMIEALLKRKLSWSGIVVAADRWAAVVEEAREISADYMDRGKAMPVWKARAARTVLGLAEDVTSREPVGRGSMKPRDKFDTATQRHQRTKFLPSGSGLTPLLERSDWRWPG